MSTECIFLSSKMSKRQLEEDADSSDTGSSMQRKWSNRRVNPRASTYNQKGKLNSDLFQLYFKNIWKSLPEVKRVPFTYLDCMWFSWYMDKSLKGKVLEWIKKKAMFSKKYVLVPIVLVVACFVSNHRCLLILCNFSEGLDSKAQKPCMLMLDSLLEGCGRRLEPAIRKFVLDIYEAKGRPEAKDEISRIPFLVPKVPQQKTGVECGNFVLYFMSLFPRSAPESFSVEAGYPYLMKEDWFGPEGYEQFCKELSSSQSVVVID